MTKTTKAQRQSLKTVFYRMDCVHDLHAYRQFRKTVQWGYGCVMVPFAGMWLGIEPDGYTHS
ncbi:MAG: hypothetical protein JRJ45_00335 [Deltaproteobacteria bacterium]|nr:hypothetical protein [Deltaproteobacteria bacterium]